MKRTTWHERMWRHPSAVSLPVRVAGLVLYPFIETTGARRIGSGVVGIVVLGNTTGMVRRTPWLPPAPRCRRGASRTCSGIGDVISVSAHARALAALVTFVCVMYLAAVVSRLIGLTLVTPATRRAGDANAPLRPAPALSPSGPGP